MKPPRLACVIYKRPARTALAFAWHQGLLRSDQRRWAAAPLALAATHEEAPGIYGVDQLAGERRCFAGDQAGQQFAGQRRPDDAARTEAVDQVEARQARQ
jgi:hypothetical protein